MADDLTDLELAAEAATPAVLDLDDAADDIRHSMSSDDRQTKAEYQRGCKALDDLISEVRRLRLAVGSQTLVAGCSTCWTQPPKFLDGQCQHCGAGGK